VEGGVLAIAACRQGGLDELSSCSSYPPENVRLDGSPHPDADEKPELTVHEVRRFRPRRFRAGKSDARSATRSCDENWKVADSQGVCVDSTARNSTRYGTIDRRLTIRRRPMRGPKAAPLRWDEVSAPTRPGSRWRTSRARIDKVGRTGRAGMMARSWSRFRFEALELRAGRDPDSFGRPVLPYRTPTGRTVRS